ncbi:hypothetical protein HPB51_013913 [Rhipicephalus microplus]|uniref:THAP-type domain-containing protein n=1 Tax=Rhipicephalus microplus TaxID=6941 RepID=A0A9J6DH47_RHIMP|nr:hypothetical protein HPB51_013913 [Rhipicephalus microplus]
MLPASPQAAYNASKTSSESPKPSDKPSEEGAPGDAGSDEVTSPRTLRLTNKTRTWSAAELLSSDSESSDTGNNRPRGKKKKPRPKGTAKKSLHRSASEPSSQAGSSKKGLAQPSKKNVCKSGGGEPVGQPKTRKSPQKGPVHCKASSEKTSLNSANTTDAAVSLNSALPVKEASMDSGRTNANAKAPPALQRDKAVRQPTIKEKDSPYRCSVQGCPSNTDECCIGLWLFALPCEEDSAPLRSAWLNSVPIDEEVNRPRSPRVCFRHFEKDDFVSNKNRLAGLYEKAVPSIRIPTQTNPKVKCKSFQGNQPNVSIRTGAPVGSSESWSVGSKGEYQNRASSNSIGTTSLTCASSGKCEIVESSYAVTTQWDCSRGSAPLLSPSERLPQNVFSAVSSKHSSSQSAKEQTFERTAEVGAGSSESNHTTACNAAFASKDQCNTFGNIVAIGQECRREPSVLEREVIPYREHVSRPGSRSTCCTPDHSSVLTENGDSEQSEGSADEWVPFDPSHEKYVIEKQYIEGEDLGMSVYCKIRWLPTSAAAIKFGGGP